ncbi:putative ankyrin repeat and zinc finger domain protein [Trypanosoma rangeli]|uniref:Putative ankyrin repeat and zinc finger domain protein n=1 Tax=Trypanosoma rangeli TaxID=5698 RepID=A0A3S5IQY8_TRYRA|nr:putative ankyrin repeat and zinc finger domain protein [Trypanosoma rangeli]RNF03240.1 putative ankyrin repeat and zinc finger domain protein [Trypanosoma rangeli]|eukprot:RNF03240.1 putative ankyrin repeat and zinc finger domain protein [Trypanosoma rangeli]
MARSLLCVLLLCGGAFAAAVLNYVYYEAAGRKEQMSNVAEIEQLLAVTRKSLMIPPRNAYEAENTYMASVERLKEARTKLSRFSGEYVERLLRDADQLEQSANNMVLRKSNPVDVLLDVDFDVEAVEGDLDEVAAAEQEMEKLEGRKKQGGRKTKNKKLQTKVENTETKEEVIGASDLTLQASMTQKEESEEAVIAESAEAEVEEVAKYAECTSTDIPQEALGEGRCLRIPDTPLVRLDFATPVEYDGIECRCRVNLYRVVVMALTYGAPSTMTIPIVATEDDLQPVNVEEELQAVEDETKLVELDDTTATAELSKQLVAEYDAILGEKEEEGATELLPLVVLPKLRDLLRVFTFLPWVILMCHGGYFAGGVFVDNKPVVHKAFQRYVVRKKQGGKQSSSEKEGGSYGSVGSQIRRAQEIKWKMDVRDILLSWRNYIDAAAIVLYVAPGPQNRAVLTDFSGLPAITTGKGERAVSPVSVQDPRVHKAPLTTHRPTFQEVQRIYKTVSTCTVEYVRYLE